MSIDNPDNITVMRVKSIRAQTGLSQRAIAERYHIPQRTWESWEMGDRQPPAYVLDLLERVVALEFPGK